VKTKKIVRKYELTVVSTFDGTSKEELVNAQAAEAEMNATDRLVIDTADKRNALEEYVYETRSKLEMAWSDFADDSSRTNFMAALTEMENWLYTEEGKSFYFKCVIFR
jgi:heat shock protein 4